MCRNFSIAGGDKGQGIGSQRPFLPAVVTALTGGILLLAVTLWPPDTGAQIVVFSPYAKKEARLSAVLRAGGRVIEVWDDRPFLLVWADHEGFSGRVRREGAWLTVSAAAGFGCAAKSQQPAFSKI